MRTPSKTPIRTTSIVAAIVASFPLKPPSWGNSVLPTSAATVDVVDIVLSVVAVGVKVDADADVSVDVDAGVVAVGVEVVSTMFGSAVPRNVTCGVVVALIV